MSKLTNTLLSKFCYTAAIMIVDGKAIASKILDSVAIKVAGLSRAPRLSAITCAPNFETQKYLEMKKQRAAAVGITLNVVELPADVSTDAVLACVEKVAKESDGVVVQLPLPEQIDRELVLAAVPVDKDPDGFLYGKVPGVCLPPVAGAIDEISRVHDIAWPGKVVIVLGAGKLVGLPTAEYARQAISPLPQMPSRGCSFLCHEGKSPSGRSQDLH